MHPSPSQKSLFSSKIHTNFFETVKNIESFTFLTKLEVFQTRRSLPPSQKFLFSWNRPPPVTIFELQCTSPPPRVGFRPLSFPPFDKSHSTGPQQARTVQLPCRMGKLTMSNGNNLSPPYIIYWALVPLFGYRYPTSRARWCLLKGRRFTRKSSRGAPP